MEPPPPPYTGVSAARIGLLGSGSSGATVAISGAIDTTINASGVVGAPIVTAAASADVNLTVDHECAQ
jgi:hypothetical protein